MTPPSDKFVLFSVRLPKNLKDKAQHKARATNTTLAAIVFHALNDFVEDRIEMRLIAKDYKPKESEKTALKDLNPKELFILSLLKEKPMGVEDIMEKTSWPVQEVLVAAAGLQMKGLILESGARFKLPTS